MIRGVIFDLGNTLIYFEGDKQQVLERGTDDLNDYLNGRGYGIPMTFADAFRTLREQGRVTADRTMVEYTTEQAVNDALTQHSICWIPDAVLPLAAAKYFDQEARHWKAYPDTIPTLELLKVRGLALGLLSNAPDHAFIERLAREAEIDSFFDPLLSSALISYRKPDARAFQRVLEAWQLKADEVVMVGDLAAFDIVGAHRAGVRGVLIANDPNQGWDAQTQAPEGVTRAELEPDAVIRRLSELPQVIDAFNAKDEVNV